MTLLKFVGRQLIKPGSALPLPEGWPALDHEEPDAQLAAEKLKSGLYEGGETPVTPRRGRTTQTTALTVDESPAADSDPEEVN